MDWKEVRLHLVDGTTLYFPYQPNNIPMMLTPSMCALSTSKVLTSWINTLFFHPEEILQGQRSRALPTVFDPWNINLTAQQKELLLWHQKLGHCNFG
jgi:hypothetical protein